MRTRFSPKTSVAPRSALATVSASRV